MKCHDVCNLFSTGSAKNTYAETDMEKDTESKLDQILTIVVLEWMLCASLSVFSYV